MRALAPGGTPGEVARYFVRLGCIAFGGPAAHVALMRRELVAERRWLSDEEFVDLLGVANLIPGPNSTEMAMHIGAHRAGWRGLWLGGAGFILPAVAIVLALAWAYVAYGDTPAAEGILVGVQPVVLAIIVQAIWGLRRAAVKGPTTLAVVVAAAALAAAGVNELLLLLGAGLASLGLALATSGRSVTPFPAGVRDVLSRIFRGRLAVVATTIPLDIHSLLLAASEATRFSRVELFLVFLKIGGLLYGSGYVLVSFLQADLVDARGWLTQQQLVDAIAAGQFTPGPLFSSATFAGYVIDGLPGAALATLGIFLPSFLFVTITYPLVPRLRRSPWAAPFLDGANAAAIALMAVVTVNLARDALDSAFQVGMLAVASVLLLRFSPNSAWLVLAGGMAGLGYRWLGG